MGKIWLSEIRWRRARFLRSMHGRRCAGTSLVEKGGKTAVQGAALKLATDAIETLEEWQKPRESRFRGNLLTEDEYEAMLEAQGGVCAICKEKPKGSRLSVDHVHGTDQVRGLLCNLCNPALGLFKDNPDRLKRAIEYLERGGSRSAGPSEREG